MYGKCLLGQVEVKIRLPDRAAHDKLAAAMATAPTAVHEQENYFFDTPDSALNATRTVLRLRFHDVDQAALVTIKVRSRSSRRILNTSGSDIVCGGTGRSSSNVINARGRLTRRLTFSVAKGRAGPQGGYRVGPRGGA